MYGYEILKSVPYYEVYAPSLFKSQRGGLLVVFHKEVVEA